MRDHDPRNCPKCNAPLAIAPMMLNMVFAGAEGPQIGGKLRPHVICSGCDFEAIGVVAHE